jgi:CBS domain-containing protein
MPASTEALMLIRDILNIKGGAIHSIHASQPLSTAVSLMVRLDIGSLVVLEDPGMTGLLTFREVLRALDAPHASLQRTRVREVMDPDPVCGSPTDTMDDLRQLMTDRHIRYLPVKDGEKLVGIISFHDVAKAVIMQTGMENRLLRRYIESQPELHADPQ